MKLAIMQPYFLPYLGYWQLLNAVDRFVIYDDVTFIIRGWINRNRILINGKPSYITVPLHQASCNRRICDLTLQSSSVWRRKMIRSIENTYRNAPFFTEVFPVVESIVTNESDVLPHFLLCSIKMLSECMGINTEIVPTSRCYQNSHLTGQDRILDICKREEATIYINPQGGQTLYDSQAFYNTNIYLRFILMRPISYKQRIAGFVPYLSIIDALMEMGSIGVKKYLDEFELTAG